MASLDQYSLDRHSRQGTSALHRADPRLKLLAALTLVAAAQLTSARFWPLPGPVQVSAVHLALAVLIGLGFYLAGIGWWFVAIRLAWFSLVLLPWALLIWLGQGLSGGGVPASTVLVKGMLAFSTLLLLINTTPYERLLAGLSRLGMPMLLVATMAAMYRYGWLLVDEMTRMRRARQARTFRPSRRLSAEGLRRGSELIGMLMVRASQRAERVHGAMLARGYDGHARRFEDCDAID
jgi:cobalt/nickel transport system permease protein